MVTCSVIMNFTQISLTMWCKFLCPWHFWKKNPSPGDVHAVFLYIVNIYVTHTEKYPQQYIFKYINICPRRTTAFIMYVYRVFLIFLLTILPSSSQICGYHFMHSVSIQPILLSIQVWFPVLEFFNIHGCSLAFLYHSLKESCYICDGVNLWMYLLHNYTHHVELLSELSIMNTNNRKMLMYDIAIIQRSVVFFFKYEILCKSMFVVWHAFGWLLLHAILSPFI